MCCDYIWSDLEGMDWSSAASIGFSGIGKGGTVTVSPVISSKKLK